MFICMRTTLNLEDNLMRALKVRAAETGRTLTSLIEEAIRESLSRPSSQERGKFNWVTVRGRVRPGVDIADRDSLLDTMEGRR